MTYPVAPLGFRSSTTSILWPLSIFEAMRSHAPWSENGSPPSGLRTCCGFHLVGRSFSNLVSLRRGCRAREASSRLLESLILTGAASPYVSVNLHHDQSYDRLSRTARLFFDHMMGDEVLTSLGCQNDVGRSVLAGANRTPASCVERPCCTTLARRDFLLLGLFYRLGQLGNGLEQVGD